MGVFVGIVDVRPTSLTNRCSLNGMHINGRCECDPGWTGNVCSVLDALPALPAAYGLVSNSVPTWGGGAVFDAVTRRWSLIVGSRAVGFTNDTKDDYPCDSRIVRAL